MFKQKPDLVILLTSWAFLVGLLEFIKPIQTELGVQYCIFFQYPSPLCGTVSQWTYSALIALQILITLVMIAKLTFYHRDWCIRNVNKMWDKNVSVWYYLGFWVYGLLMIPIVIMVIIGLNLILMGGDPQSIPPIVNTIAIDLLSLQRFAILFLLIYSSGGIFMEITRYFERNTQYFERKFGGKT